MKCKKLLLLLLVLCMSSFLHAQVVVNEYQNNGGGVNGGDIIELLVTQDNADLRGLIIKDFSNTNADDLNSGGFQFTQNSLWNGVRAGTLIVLKQNGATITTDVTANCSDYNLEVGLSNTTYFTDITPTGGGIAFDIQNNDMVMVRSEDPAAPGFYGVTYNIHTLRGGTQTALWTSIIDGAKLGSNTGPAATGRCNFVNNATTYITDYNLGTTGVTGNSTLPTIGTFNNANNTTFINFLRGPLSVTSSAVNPVGFTANWAALTNASTYILDVSTDPTFATFVTGYSGLNVGLVTTYPVVGLAPATTYYFRVRSIDNSPVTPSTSANSCVTTVTTSASSSKTTIANGAWNNAAIWSPAGVPASTDDVVTVNHIVTMPVAVTRAAGTTTTISSGASLAIAVAYTNSGTTNVNGTFQLDTGGSVTGNNFVYGAAGTLNFNSSTVYAVVNTHAFWPSTNSPYNVNVLQGGITMTSANRTVAGTFTTASSVALTTTVLTLNGTCQINTGGSFTNAPTYGNASTLVYNPGGSYTVSNEWTTSSLAAGLGVPQNVTIQNSTALTTPATTRGMAGNLNINSGSLILANTFNIGGNWTRVSTATFTPSGKNVSFIGASVQTVMVSPTGTETYFSLTKSGTGTLKLTTGTNVTVTGASGFILASTNASSGLDLNGQSLTLTGGGNFSLLLGNRFITSTVAGGSFVVSAGAANTTVSSPGTLVTDANTIIKLYSGLSCGAAGSFVTINGTLEIETGGFCFGNAPKYGSGSLLRYNSGTNPFLRNTEWSAVGVGTTGTTPGYPFNVQVSNSTVVDYPNSAAIGIRAMGGDFTIDSGSALHMNYNNVSTTGSLIVAGNVTNAGTLTLGFAFGDDLKLGGNFVNTGTFNGNDRAIFFTKNGTQTVSSTSALTIPYVVFAPASGATTVQLLCNVVVSATLTGSAIIFSSASDVFDLNGNSLTIGSTGVANVITGSGTFKGSTTSNLTLLGTGSIGTVSFATNQNLGTFTINRTSAAVACVMGSAVTVNTSLALTAGIVDLANTAMTLGASATISGASASNFVIADVLNGSTASLLKNFTAAGSFTFPIGDSAASANGSQYSPVSVTFTGGTYAGYAGFAVDDIKEPNMDANVHYITRYWAMYSSGVTPTSYSVTGTYLPADIVGTETSSTSNQWDGSAWTNGGTAIGSNTMVKSGNTTVPVVNHFTAGSRDPEINIQQAGTNYLTGSTYNFGTLASLTPVSVTFTIQNLGGQTLNLSAATFTGTPNYTYTTAYASTVAGNSSVTFVVTFSPSANGTFTGSISIPNNDSTGAENPYVLNFTGIASACATTTWNGLSWSPSAPTISSAVVINGNYSTTSGSFESCSLTINNGFTLTVKTNTYIVVNNDLTVNSGATLIVEDKGSLVMLNDAGVVTNNGTTQVLRTTSPYEQFDYTYWSSPVNASVISTTFTGWRTDYSFDFATANFADTLTINSSGTVTAATADSFDDYAPWAWQNFTGTMTNGKGYAIMGPTNVAFTPTATATVTFSGKVNNGVVSVPIVESANATSTIDDYNLIGNPYPSAISANSFITTNGAKTSGTLYFWTHVANISASNPGPSNNNFISDDYAVYNMTGGTSASLTGSTTPTGYIASGQGFFVEAQGNNSVIFNDAMRSKTYSNSDFFKSASTQEPNTMDRLWLNLQNADGMFSQLLLAYSDQTTMDYDWGYDGRVNQSPNYLSFYTIAGSDMYKIQARSAFDLNDVVPIGYFSAVAGEFTIGLGQQDGILNAPETPIYLEDVTMNIVHDLRQGPYVFTTDSGRFINRFRLRYATDALAAPTFDALNSSVVATTTAGTLQLNSSLDVLKDVTVYDVLGRQLYAAHDIMNHQWSTTGLTLSNQTLLLKITLGNGTVITRKVAF